MTTMLLGGAKSNTAIDQPTYINVDLAGTNKLFKKTKIDETIDLYSLYKREKDACMRYRLLFVVNPICSNALFNVKTEAVAFEGSDYCVPISDRFYLKDILSIKNDSGHTKELDVLRGEIERGANDKIKAVSTSELKLYDAIRDTELSHEELGNFSYHCGADICNNHIMRSKEFVFCNFSKSGETFNTIEDYVRTEKGTVERDYTSTSNTDESVPARLYTVDNIMTFSESFNINIKEKDGWLGFNNDSNININNVQYGNKKNPRNISVNRVINNIGACSFVDLYPDRTLFSAVPKYNKYRNRQEHNWDYILTYPAKNDYDILYKVNGHDKCGKIEETGPLGMAMEVERVIYSNGGEKAILFKTGVNHNLHVGHYITMFLEKQIGNDYEIDVSKERIQVVGVGDEEGFGKEKYFSVRESDMPGGISLYNENGIAYYYSGDNTVSRVKFSYRHNINHTNCQYYIRKFKKIQNITYDVTKLAFGNNIYGDEMAQLMINDDVDLSGLRDNLGRELSEIYLTIIKTNRGHNNWYARSGANSLESRIQEELELKRDPSVEFSHCFGKVTSGFKLNSDTDDYNVLRLHNIDFDSNSDNNFDRETREKKRVVLPNGIGKDDEHTSFSGNYSDGTIGTFGKITPPKAVEDDITLENINNWMDDETYICGDIVEFNPNTFEETILAPIYYRFNTEQRECYYNEEYFDVWKDEVVSDNFEVITGNTLDENFNISDNNSKKEFTVEKLLVNITESVSAPECGSKDSEMTMIEQPNAGNLNLEGYYYNPHHKIIVKELADEVSEVETNRINLDFNNTYDNFIVKDKNKNYDLVRIVSPRNYGFQKGGSVMFYDANTQKTAFGVIDTLENSSTIIVKVLPDSGIEDINNVANAGVDVIPEETTTFSPDFNNVYGIRSNLLVLSSTATIPSYAVFRPSTASYIWRPTKKVTDSTSDSPLYDIPFSNGAIYIEKNINLFLLRQDPHSENYMYNYDESKNVSTSSDDCGKNRVCYSYSIGSFLRKEGMPKLDIRYLLEGDDNISFDLC